MEASKQINTNEKESQQKEERMKAKKYLLTKLFRSKRQKDADALLQEAMESDETLIEGFRHNKFGAFCLQAGDLKRAEQHLLKAKQIISAKFPYSNVWMNLGNLEAQQKNYQKAIDNYDKVLEVSPHNNMKKFEGKDEIVFSKMLNSFTAYVDAHTNLAVMHVQLDHFQLGFQYCEKSLELKPEDSQSLINFTDFLRQLGKKDEAIKRSWKDIIDYTKKNGNQAYQGFKAVEIKSWKKEQKIEENQTKHISILTVKWGTRYNADYVNKLYAGIQRHTSWKFTFHCFTDDPKDLNPAIITHQLQEGWKRWWGKVTLFNVDIPGRKFYIDLDMIITGSLDELFSYKGQFATLRTGDLACQKNHKEGYNSSVMMWQGNLLQPVYHALKENFDVITKFIVRFDFWLQMTINNADYIQVLYPRAVIDFLADAKENLPAQSSVVCFARKPKPQDYPAEWVKQHWIL